MANYMIPINAMIFFAVRLTPFAAVVYGVIQ